jgi:hypothetical protein
MQNLAVSTKLPVGRDSVESWNPFRQKVRARRESRPTQFGCGTAKPLFGGYSTAGFEMKRFFIFALSLGLASTVSAQWKRHVIDVASIGADGARLADANGDQLPDIVTGWEEGGMTRITFHPEMGRVGEKWPAVTVGLTPDVEDAVLVDLDGDGALDVVSSCEGKTRSIFVHWAPTDKKRLFDSTAWRTEPLPASTNLMKWMFTLPMQIDGMNGVDFFAGGKDGGAAIGWFEAPANSRRLGDWKWRPLRPVGWTMSLVTADMDGDGDPDLVFSDRKGKRSGAYWLENPGRGEAQRLPWKEHLIGGEGKEVMFLQLADLDRDGLEDVVVATRPSEILFLRRMDQSGNRWQSYSIPLPPEAGGAKAVSVGDIDLDGKPDLVFTCENAQAPRQGVCWLSYEQSPMSGVWRNHAISGVDGVKHDLAPLLDLDGDGDLDVITTEEVKKLGVIWYENPTRTR